MKYRAMLISRYGNVVDSELVDSRSQINAAIWARVWWRSFLRKQRGSRIRVDLLP